jgi:hypothetical protein
VVPDANTGLNVPELSTKSLRSAFEEATRVTVVVYVFVVVPFSAITAIVITLLPTFNVIALLACPLTTAVPFTVTVAVVSATVGVTVTLVTELATLEL